MGVGGGAQSCACGGCRWVTHPHRSLLHQFWWGKAPLIGFVENDLPPVGREGRRLTASRAAPYPGGCLMRAKRPQRQAASPALVPLARQDTVPPSRPPLGNVLRALIKWLRRHHAGSGGQAMPTATSTVPPLSFSRSSCSPIDAARCASGAVKVASHPEGSRRRRMESGSSGTFSIADEACWQAQASSFYHYST